MRYELDTHMIELFGVDVEVYAELIPAQNGGMDDPSWPEFFEIRQVRVGGVDITSWLGEVEGFENLILTKLEELKKADLEYSLDVD